MNDSDLQDSKTCSRRNPVQRKLALADVSSRYPRANVGCGSVCLMQYVRTIYMRTTKPKSIRGVLG